MSDKVYTVQDYKSGQPRWCPGCGDHAPELTAQGNG